MKFYKSNLLNSFANLTHTFTTKKSSNLAFHVNDDENKVKLNHKLLANELDYSLETLVHMKQIHSDIVHTLSKNDNFSNPPICDALITDKINTPLMVMVADCSPILFYDNVKKIIAVAHAGRQGAFKNIIQNVLESFQNNFNTNIKNIYVSIGANIGNCCYRVGYEIYEEAKRLDLGYAIDKRDNYYYLNISKILKTQLLVLGIKKEHIEISDECTKCNSDKYFSYRADSKCGRFVGIIMLK
ncbi:MAG: peptidoglycan editing factor PgeF [Sulfurimonas sp.]|nr:peptidoglycan editing factor PgeF [Sulfurimonas sp.]